MDPAAELRGVGEENRKFRNRPKLFINKNNISEVLIYELSLSLKSLSHLPMKISLIHLRPHIVPIARRALLVQDICTGRTQGRALGCALLICSEQNSERLDSVRPHSNQVHREQASNDYSKKH